VLARALGLAAVWLSPAVLLGLPPLLLSDGTRGLWAPLVLAAGACLAAVALAAPWSALSDAASLQDLALARWGAMDAAGVPLTIAGAGSALLFLWAQLAAVRELAQGLGWPVPIALGLAVIVSVGLGALEGPGRRIGRAAAGLALLGLLVPLAAVLATTDPVWPRVWEAVASRPRIVFGGGSRWVREGRPLHGFPEVTLRVTEEQRVTLLGPGSVRLEAPDGAAWSREISAPIDLTVRPGDRLVLPDGFSLRFQPGRAIPGAPRSGADWADPGIGPDGWRALAGLAVTLLIGGLGLAPVHGAMPAGGPGATRAAATGAVMAAVGLLAAVLWSLYTAWLTPEAYLPGVAASEVYELSAGVGALGALGAPLRDLALVGLGGGGLAAVLSALAGTPGGVPGVRLGCAVAAGLLAALHPLGAWPVLLLAFGFAAATGAPAAILTGWTERLSPLGLSLGVAVGLVTFGALELVQLAGLVGPPDRDWLSWLAAWPALAAGPLAAVTAWLVSLTSTRDRAIPPALGTDR
jgi:hypothetical protein